MNKNMNTIHKFSKMFKRFFYLSMNINKIKTIFLFKYNFRKNAIILMNQRIYALVN